MCSNISLYLFLQQFWSMKINERILNVVRSSRRKERQNFQAQDIELPKSKPGRKRKSIEWFLAVPAIPEGETVETLETQRGELGELCKSRREQDKSKVKSLMSDTYPLRRQDVLTKNLRVWELLKQYPPLKDDKGIQVYNKIYNI